MAKRRCCQVSHFDVYNVPTVNFPFASPFHIREDGLEDEGCCYEFPILSFA